MKKSIIFTLIMLMVLNIALTSEMDIVYAAEAEVRWLEKGYDDYYPYSFSEGKTKIVLDGIYGYIDEMGNEVIPLNYEWGLNFSEGLAGVSLDNKYGYIDKDDKKVIPFKYDWVNVFSEGLGVVGLKDKDSYIEKYGYIDKTGKEVIPLKYDSAEIFSENLAAVELKGKWGYIDKTGKEVIPLKYDSAETFSENLAAVELKGKWGYIDKKGNEVIPLKYNLSESFSEGLALVKLGDKSSFIDKDGKEVIAMNKYNGSEEFSEGFAAVVFDDKCGYIDKTGKELIPLKNYDYAHNFSEGLALVELNGKNGYIDKTGKEVVSLQYDNATSFSEGLAIVKLDNKSGIMKNLLLKQQDTKPKDKFKESIIAVPTESKVLVNGKDISFDAYVINQNNYFKLRDLATVVRATEKEFEVSWDENKKAINLISNKAYTSVGGEMIKGKGGNKVAKLNTSTIYKDGSEIDLIAYTINGNNYFKLRDVAEAFDIGVTWDGETKTVGINTVDEKLLIYNSNGYKNITWKQDYLIDKNKKLNVDLNNDGKLDFISVGRDTPNGEKVLIICNDLGINLLNYISAEMLQEIEYLYDDYGELKEGNMIQITLVDFDGDGKEEIILAIGDGLVNLGVAVFEIDYNSKDLDVKEIGFFAGQEKIYIDENKDIIIPIGGQGLYMQYKYDNRKFIEVVQD